MVSHVVTTTRIVLSDVMEHEYQRNQKMRKWEQVWMSLAEMSTGLRWAVSLEETMSSSGFANVFRKAVLCVSEQDVEQQRRFRYKEDALACLIGRAMPRKAAVLQTSLSWSSLEFDRTEIGKPFLKLKNKENFEYNVSHHGDLVVMATGESRIGVDVMRIDEDRRSSAMEQMKTLKRHFSQEEIDRVKSRGDEKLRWRAFFRIWCLKESILKATGVGLPDGLHNHTFRVDSQVEHIPGLLTVSSQYFHRGTPQPQWHFEESFVGENHCVAVASESKCSGKGFEFQMTSLESILTDADFINVDAEVDDELDAFMQKPNKPF